MKRLGWFVAFLLLLGMAAELQADDLEPAVHAVREVLRQHNLPANWLAKEPEPVDPLIRAAIWRSVDPQCAAAVKKALGWRHEARGLLYEDYFLATNGLYEEVVSRALFGSQHAHADYRLEQRVRVTSPPNLRRDLLNEGGVVAFDRVLDSLKGELSTRAGTGDIAFRHYPSRGCLVVSKWTAWDSPNLEWVRQGYAWRGVFICSVVAGRRELSDGFTDGPSRFAITSYLEVGKRDGDSYEQIARSPAIGEYVLIPVGRKQIESSYKAYRLVPRDHPTTAETATPTAESETYTKGLRDHYAMLVKRSHVAEHFSELHRELWELLSER